MLMEEKILNHCFVCGPSNTTGLQLDILYGDGEARAEFLPDARWEGYPGVVHGGLLSAMLDDLMCHAFYSASQQLAVTATMEVRFRHPARIGSRLYCNARTGKRHGRLMDTEGEIRDQDGWLIATAKSRLMIMSRAQMDGFTGAANAGER